MRLLAATADGLHRIDGDGVERLADGDVAAVAADGQAAWAIVDDATLIGGGLDGPFVPLAEADVALRCLLPGEDSLLVGTAEAGLVRWQGGRLTPVPGFAQVDGREHWSTPWGAPPDTRSLAGAERDTLYANVHVGGVPRSTDGGRTWEPTIDVDADVHEVAVTDGLVLVAAAGGLAVSADRGQTWQWRLAGLHEHYARSVAVAADTVLLSVSAGPGGRRAGLYRGALDASGALTRCTAGLPAWFAGNVDTGCVAASGAEVALADGGSVYASTDAGRSWGLLAEGLAPVRWLSALTD